MNTIKYQPEIDGIRAIAVIGVVLFHLEYKFIPGGYVGVDVFFVISGFLITRILYRDVQNGQFSFSTFYLRRIRRLAPALIAVLLATFLVACIYLIPNHFQRFSGALVASVFSLSNLFFWLESGYFDASADLKPLLHTWSLSVEEQFYLLWPALLFFSRDLSRRQLLWIIVALGGMSLIAARIFSAVEPTASFFLMPFRIYEFALGAALALWQTQNRFQTIHQGLVAWLKEAGCLLGLALIVYSCLVFDKSTPFPDVYALVPCVGAVLLIACGDARIVGGALRNPVSVWIGKISYSLYLVHWPIVVLYKHMTFEDVVVGKTRIALLLLTMVLAYLLYQLVENRFRYGSSARNTQPKRYLLAWLCIPVALVAVSAHAYQSNGWVGRFDPAVMRAIGDIEAKQFIRREYIETPTSLSNLPFDSPSEKTVKLLVMGDSHATDMFNALYLNLIDNPQVSIRRLEIDDTCLYLFAQSKTDQSEAAQRRCENQFSTVQSSELLQQADRVLLSTRWEATSLQYIPMFIEFLRESVPTVVMLGRTAEFKNVPALVIKQGLTDEIGQQLATARFTQLDALNDQLSALSRQLDLQYVDKLPFLCPAHDWCDVIDDDGFVLYTDYGHWTVEGATYFGRRFLNSADARQKLIGSLSVIN